MKAFELKSALPKIYSAGNDSGSVLVGNPIYVSAILTVIVLIILNYIIEEDCLYAKIYLRLFVYIMAAACMLLTMHHNVHVKALASEYKNSGVQDVYNSIDTVRASGIMPSHPVPVNTEGLVMGQGEGGFGERSGGSHKASEGFEGSFSSGGGFGERSGGSYSSTRPDSRTGDDDDDDGNPVGPPELVDRGFVTPELSLGPIMEAPVSQDAAPKSAFGYS